MTWLHRQISNWFNRVDPVEPPNSPYRGVAGAGGIHFQDPGLNQCAEAHDADDDLIRSGQTTDTYEDNDARFQRCIDIAEEDRTLYLNNGEHRKSRILAALSGNVIDLYRWLRGESSGPSKEQLEEAGEG